MSPSETARGASPTDVGDGGDVTRASNAGSAAAAADADAGATLAARLGALQARGAQRAEPVRFRHAEALLRRAATQPEAVRAQLHARLGGMLDRWADELASAAARAPGAGTRARAPEAGSPIGELLRRLGVAPTPTAATGSASAGGRGAPPPVAPHGLAPAEPPALRSVRRFQATYVRLRAEQRLTQSRALVHDQAGPLNAHRLLHLALRQMGATAPAYLQRYMAYVDALLWLDAATMPAPPNAPAAPARRGSRKRG